jgi:hypothetical protein
MTTEPVLIIDLPTAPELLGDLPALAVGLEAAGVGALSLSGDAEHGDLHPVHVAASLAPLTTSVSLLARTDAVDVEPFHLATQLASLDHVAHGRSGWLVQTRTDRVAAAAVGREPLSPEQAARETADVVTASRLVWDSWTDDAVIRDRDSGRYIDAARLQYADFEGESFSVRGPAITPRPPQGQVPVLVADQDRESVGRDVAQELSDGRVLDVRVEAGAGAEEIASAVLGSLELAAGTDRLRGVRVRGLVDPGRTSPDAPAPDVPAPDAPAPDVPTLAGRVADAVTLLWHAEAIAPAPTPGLTLRDQLGLLRPEVIIDPARRSDRARLARV